MMKAILFSVLLFISLSSSEIIQFDITQESNCAAPIGCSFTNSSIWINNTIPYLSTDVVIISGSSADSQLLIYIPGNYSTYSINSLSLSNATLVLNDFASLQVVSFNFGANSTFNTINASTFLVDPKGENRDVSVLSMPSHGDFTCEWNIGGYVLVNTTAILTGDITIDQSADVFLQNVFYYPYSIEDDYHNLHMGTINIPHYATVTFDDDVVAFFLNVSNNATVIFKGDVNISQIYVSDFSVVNFEDNNVFLGPSTYSAPTFDSLSLSLSYGVSVLPPLSGSASSQVVTSSCDLSILGEDAFTYAGSFSDDSFNQAQSNYYLQKMRVALPLSFYPTLTGNGLIIDGSMTTSNVVSAVGAGISITTSAMFYGPININTTIDVQQGGQLTFATDIFGSSYNATYGPGASVTVAGIFMGQNIYIPSGASLVATTANSSLIINNLYIDGTLDCTKGNGFIQGGNVTLGPNSNYLASLRTQFNAPLSVALGNVHLLGGNVSYTIDKRPVGNKEYELISTTYTVGYYVDGSFNGNHAVALHDSLVERTLPLKYTTGSVFVKYNLSVKDVPTWAWIVGAAGAAAIILIIVVISVCIVKRRRHNYKPVR